MIYSCRKCGREFQWEEAVSFCPFCGNAYASFAVASPSPATRVVIGSDSERTVQEKYWRMSHKEIDGTIRLLGALLPTEENVQPCQFDLHEWLQQQKRCRSARQFKKNCDSFLSKIASFLQQERFWRGTGRSSGHERSGGQNSGYLPLHSQNFGAGDRASPNAVISQRVQVFHF